MIEELSVRNFALIDSLSLSFSKGFTILTGETGAGKSIIVGALSFLMGAKADTELIRSGSDEASVSAVVCVDAGNRDALEWLKRRDIENEDGRLIIRRSVKSQGRNSIYIQNVPVTRNDLNEFMGFMFDLHGQHTHESLLRKETHRLYLDRFSGLEDEVMAFNKLFMELAEKRKTLEALNQSERDREMRIELLNFSVDEITKANPVRGEIKELEIETQRLGDFEKLTLHVNTIASAMFDDESSLLSLARRSRTALESAASIDSSLLPILKRLEDLYYEADDIAGDFRNYRDRLSYDPARLAQAEERLSLLYRLKKKYTAIGRHSAGQKEGEGSPEENPLDSPQENPLDEAGILLYRDEALAEIEALSGAEQNRDKLKSEIGVIEKELASRAKDLSAKRREGAGRLGAGITKILSKLGMPNAVFSSQVTAKAGEGGHGLVLGPWGGDDVEFMISANKGEPLKELARIASGGELSRVMLAIKTILCGNLSGETQGDTQAEASAETLVFDEVDSGIGGEVALAVGEYLSLIGRRKQIFCITHLASIAVRADNHLKVEKNVITDGTGKQRTVTGVCLLKKGERRKEIARMLAGESGNVALAHADELLAKYSNRG